MKRVQKTLAETIYEALQDAKVPGNERLIRDDKDLSYFISGWLRGAFQGKQISDLKGK